MSIAHYIQQEVLLPRARDARVLVVYDEAKRYRDLCLGLSTDEFQVVDASESSIESRDAALRGFVGLGGGGVEALLIYVPIKPPITEEDKQRDPFATFAVCGTTFPKGDGDDYQSLCLKAKPDHATAIRKIFSENSSPSFAVLDKVGGGSGWPNCQAVLNTESARGILYALLAPTESQLASLKAGDAWVSEVKDLFQETLGLKLRTKAKSWSHIADELWTYVLFSEFVFDLPEALPESLEAVPKAEVSAAPLIQDLCDRLRNTNTTQAAYIDRAASIEEELKLVERCAAIGDLGERDTFPFEERTFFARAVTAVRDDEIEVARDILRGHTNSVWIGKGESQVQWSLLRSALNLIEACNDCDRELAANGRSQSALLDYYIASLREVDRLQREFEQAYGDYIDFDDEDVLTPVITQARSHYGQLVAKAQSVFIRHLEASGWPPEGRLANTDTFDHIVAPMLQEAGQRVAYLQIDALRYELGVALHQLLVDDDLFDIQAAYAPLPSITRVGMAGLLPGASQSLALTKKDDGYNVTLDGAVTESVPQRMKVFSKKYGDRFAEMPLKDFVRSKKDVPQGVDLLVLRDVDIDSVLENNPEMALKLVHDTLKTVRAGINKLSKQGFHKVVIATDHGFFLNAHAEAGDVCQKPAGTWILEHERCLLGDGSEDSNNLVMPADKVGIRGDYAQFGAPRSMAPYRKGMMYFHGGASLQESVVPVITGALSPPDQPKTTSAEVILKYKNGATRIATLLPVIEVYLEGDMFSQDTDFEILLEAQSKKGDVVGEAKNGDMVNPATGAITLKTGSSVKVTLKMVRAEEFEGGFTVRAIDPKTLATLATLDLKTDYLV